MFLPRYDLVDDMLVTRPVKFHHVHKTHYAHRQVHHVHRGMNGSRCDLPLGETPLGRLMASRVATGRESADEYIESPPEFARAAWLPRCLE
jgi:hypothetical protein